MSDSNYIHSQEFLIRKENRALLNNHQPCCIWFTGLSASGKSTIASHLEFALYSRNTHTYLLDGDNIRLGLNKDLGFSKSDREENIRRVAELARLMVDAGLVVIVSFISPFKLQRDFARSLFDQKEFIEVYIDTDLSVCESRDPKGLYYKARMGELRDFTGIDSPYEPPLSPEIIVKTLDKNVGECVNEILKLLPF